MIIKSGVDIKKFLCVKFPIIIITITGLVLRLIGITWGSVVSSFHPDEQIVQLSTMANGKTLICHIWVYPCQVTSKILSFFLYYYIRAFHHLGIPINLTSLDYTYYYRVIIALQSTVIIWISYLIMKKIRGYNTAILFSALITINPIFVKYSKMIVTDTSVLMFSLILAYVSLKYIDDQKIKYLIIVSACAACSTLEKWNGAVVCFYIAIVVIFTQGSNIKRIILHGAIAFCSYCITVILIAPNILVEVNKVLEDAWFAYNFYGGREYPSITAYPVIFCSYIGFIGTLILVLGVFYVLKKRNKYCLIYYLPVVFLLCQWAFMTRTAAERWGQVIYWGMTALLAEGIIGLSEILGKKWWVYVISSIVFVSFFAETLFYNTVAVKSKIQDTRSIGESVFYDLGITTDNTLSSAYTTLCPGGSRIPEVGEMIHDNYSPLDEFVTVSDGKPCLAKGKYHYIVLGGVYDQKRTDGVYEIVREKGKLVTEIEAEINGVDLFWTERGHGGWNVFELDSIRKTIRETAKIMDGASMGFDQAVYDVSDYIHTESTENK